MIPGVLWLLALAAGACLVAWVAALWADVGLPAGLKFLDVQLPAWGAAALYVVSLACSGLAVERSLDLLEPPYHRRLLPASAAAFSLLGIGAGFLVAPTVCLHLWTESERIGGFWGGLGPFLSGATPWSLCIKHWKLARSRSPESPHSAARAGFRQTVERFLADGMSLDVRDEEGRTMLHCAAERAHLEVARFLLARGADPNVRTKEGETPLFSLASGGAARSRAATEFAQLLLIHGADVDAEDSEGYTPLHAAASSDAHRLVRLFLERGAKVTARARPDGDTPLHCAAFSGACRAAAALLEHGANASARLSSGESALDLATEAGARSMVRLLKAHGARGGTASRGGADQEAQGTRDGADRSRGSDAGREA